MFRVGQLVISAVPAEFTTMSGRYLKKRVSEVGREERGRNETTKKCMGRGGGEVYVLL